MESVYVSLTSMNGVAAAQLKPGSDIGLSETSSYCVGEVNYSAMPDLGILSHNYGTELVT